MSELSKYIIPTEELQRDLDEADEALGAAKTHNKKVNDIIKALRGFDKSKVELVLDVLFGVPEESYTDDGSSTKSKTDADLTFRRAAPEKCFRSRKSAIRDFILTGIEERGPMVYTCLLKDNDKVHSVIQETLEYLDVDYEKRGQVYVFKMVPSAALQVSYSDKAIVNVIPGVRQMFDSNWWRHVTETLDTLSREVELTRRKNEKANS